MLLDFGSNETFKLCREYLEQRINAFVVIFELFEMDGTCRQTSVRLEMLISSNFEKLNIFDVFDASIH